MKVGGWKLMKKQLENNKALLLDAETFQIALLEKKTPKEVKLLNRN